jgi:hypothetical protein
MQGEAEAGLESFKSKARMVTCAHGRGESRMEEYKGKVRDDDRLYHRAQAKWMGWFGIPPWRERCKGVLPGFYSFSSPK